MSNENDVFTVDDIDARIDEIFGPEDADKSPNKTKKTEQSNEQSTPSDDDSNSINLSDNGLDHETEVKPAESTAESKTLAADLGKTVELTEIAPDMNDPSLSFDTEDAVLEEHKEKSETSSNIKDSNVLDKLNTIVLSMDWEIDDQIMKSFIQEVEKLKSIFRKDKFIFPLLQIHNSVGKYINSKKANAHPDSIKLLNSVYKLLEGSLTNKNITDAEKSKLIFGEVQKLRSLKKTISELKSGSLENGSGKPSPKNSVQKPKASSVERMIADLKKELTDVIKNEFAKLRDELKK